MIPKDKEGGMYNPWEPLWKNQVSSDEPILMSTIIFVLLILSLSHPPIELIPHEIGWGNYLLKGRSGMGNRH